MTRYIVVIEGLIVKGQDNQVIAFDRFDTAYHFLLAHENSNLYEIPSSGIGPCENLGKE